MIRRILILLFALFVLLGQAVVARAAQKPPYLKLLARLRLAVSSYNAGRYEDCANTLSSLSPEDVWNPDVLTFLEGQCRFYAGKPREAQESFLRLARDFPKSPYALLGKLRWAEAAWLLGEKPQAVDEFEKVSALSSRDVPRVDLAPSWFNRALYLLEKQKDKEGLRLWKELCIRFALHPLAALFPGSFKPVFSLSEALRLGSALHFARQWERALSILDEAPKPDDEAARYRLAFQRGRILFDMRGRYEEASRALFEARDLAPSPEKAEEAWLWGSRALGRMGQEDQAIASHPAMLEKYPSGRNADKALYYAAWLQQNQNRCDKAMPLFQKLWERFPRSAFEDEARWCHAWCQIDKKDYKGAIDTLKTHLENPEPQLANRANYWTGYAHAQLGQHADARSFWVKNIQRYPLTWYSSLALARLGKKAPSYPAPPSPKAGGAAGLLDLFRAPLTRGPEPPEPQAVAPGPPAPPPPPPSAGDDKRLVASFLELWEASLGGLAVDLLRREEKSFLARHPGREGLIAWMGAYRKAGNTHYPWRLGLLREPGALRRLPIPESRYLWEHAYPPCARPLLRKYSRGRTLFVWLAQSIMRTESGFDSMALSVANARGLMQLIPPVAERIARENHLEFNEDLLFDPEINIRLALWYLNKLWDKFHGQFPLVAASYNGGPRAVMDWCKKFGQLPLDVFVESIPWEESRQYVKKVTEAMSRYAYLEGGPLPRLSLKVNPDYLDDGLDF